MTTSIQWCDVDENLKNGVQPVIMLERPTIGGRSTSALLTTGGIGRCGEFWVPTTDLAGDGISWTITVQGDLVRVPMQAYRTETASRGAILATGLELGFRAADSFLSQSEQKIASVNLMLGSEVHKVDSQYRCYIGMAIRVVD